LTHQRVEHGLGNRVDVFTVPLAEPTEEQLREERNILASVAKGRDDHRKDVQAIVQIRSECASLSHVP